MVSKLSLKLHLIKFTYWFSSIIQFLCRRFIYEDLFDRHIERTLKIRLCSLRDKLPFLKVHITNVIARQTL